MRFSIAFNSCQLYYSYKYKLNIKCKQLTLNRNKKKNWWKFARAYMYHIWTNDNWELKCFSDHKTGNNSTVVSEQKKDPICIWNMNFKSNKQLCLLKIGKMQITNKKKTSELKKIDRAYESSYCNVGAKNLSKEIYARIFGMASCWFFFFTVATNIHPVARGTQPAR